MTKQSGFVPITVAIVILVVLLAGAAYFYLVYLPYHYNPPDPPPPHCTPDTKQCPDGSSVAQFQPYCEEFYACPKVSDDIPDDWKTYSDKNYGFEFKYPPNYIVVSNLPSPSFSKYVGYLSMHPSITTNNRSTRPVSWLNLSTTTRSIEEEASQTFSQFQTKPELESKEIIIDGVKVNYYTSAGTRGMIHTFWSKGPYTFYFRSDGLNPGGENEEIYNQILSSFKFIK